MANKRYEPEDNGLTEQQKTQAAQMQNLASTIKQGAAQTPANALDEYLLSMANGGTETTPNNQNITIKTTTTKNPNGINPKGIVKTNTSPSAKQKLDTTLPSPNLTNGSIAGRPAADGYSESAEVQAAREAYQNALQGRPQYQQSPAVLNAQAALDQLQNTKPQGYESKWGPALENLLQQIQNPGKFNYEFNGDNLFKQFADMYTQQGRQASMNAMGEAAALTGGYGNSYAQMAGTQANQQYLTQLYDRGMELRDRAYQQFLDEQQNTLQQYNVLAQADERDYGRYRDTVGDWENERGYLTDRYDTERNYDYGQYRDTVSDWQNQRDFAAGQYNNERSIDYGRYQDQRDFAEQQYQYDTEIQERVREFDESLNWDKLSAQQKYAAEYCMQILARGQMPTDDMLKAAGLSQADAAKLKATKKSGGGTGTKKSTTGNSSTQPMDYYTANLEVLKNTPVDVPLSAYGYEGNNNTLLDYAARYANDQQQKAANQTKQSTMDAKMLAGGNDAALEQLKKKLMGK